MEEDRYIAIGMVGDLLFVVFTEWGKYPVNFCEIGNGKNPDGQGFKSGDFFAPSAKKYYSSLDGLDSRNGRRMGIVFRNWV